MKVGTVYRLEIKSGTILKNKTSNWRPSGKLSTV